MEILELDIQNRPRRKCRGCSCDYVEVYDGASSSANRLGMSQLYTVILQNDDVGTFFMSSWDPAPSSLNEMSRDQVEQRCVKDGYYILSRFLGLITCSSQTEISPKISSA